MKILDLRRRTVGGLARVSGKVLWEESDRPEREIFFDTDPEFGDGLSRAPHAFLVAAFIPAMKHGEKRLLVEGPVCPELRNGLHTAMQLLRSWYGAEGHRPLHIEPTEGFVAPLPHIPQRAAMLMSGGVDALATLRTNRQDFSLDHPASIRDGFLVHGFDVGGYEFDDKNVENFRLALSSLRDLADEANVTLIPVYTNLRHLDDNDYLFATEQFGAALASVAHAFSNRITTGLIAASWHVSDLMPWGSHPLLDPNYSSSNVAIRHDGVRFSRLDKVRLVSEWSTALRFLRVCFNPFRPSEHLNCGRCEKCLRTMTELLILGKLDDCETFPTKDVTAEMIAGLLPGTSHLQNYRDACFILGPGAVCYWQEMIDPLRKGGRSDLAQAIEEKLAECRKCQAQAQRAQWRTAAKHLDTRYLGGALARMKRQLRGRSERLG